MSRTTLFLISFLASLCFMAGGCASQESLQQLEKRVADLEQKQVALEQKQIAKDADVQDRQTKLEVCVTQDADEAYWSYIKLNAKPIAGEPGAWRAPQYQWDQAEKRKRDKIEECKLLYGPR